MSLQTSSELWDGVTFWLAVFGTVLLFISVVTGIVARRFARRLSEEKSIQAEAEKRTHDQAIAKLGKETAEANARTEQARLEGAKLRRFIQPRPMAIIPNAEPYRLLKKYPGNVLIQVIPDAEARHLAYQLQLMVASVGWHARIINNSESRQDAYSIPDGLMVQCEGPFNSEVMPKYGTDDPLQIDPLPSEMKPWAAAEALHRYFDFLGVENHFLRLSPLGIDHMRWIKHEPGAIVILVGVKPIPTEWIMEPFAKDRGSGIFSSGDRYVGPHGELLPLPTLMPRPRK